MTTIYTNVSLTPILCEHGCGQPATHKTKSSLGSGPFGGRPVHQCARSHNSCPAVKQRKIESSLKKYGTEYPWQSKEVSDKRDETNIRKYGNKCSLLNLEQSAKRKSTMIERYGVTEPTLNDSIRHKASLGVKQAFVDDPTLKVRQIQTKNQKYGRGWKSSVAKTKATQIANGRWVDPAMKTEWERYKHLVKHHTAKNYRQYKICINPSDLPTGVCKYQVDHIYSIRHGFENNIDPTIISHPANLRMLWHVDNKAKHIRSDIDIDELHKKIAEWK